MSEGGDRIYMRWVQEGRSLVEDGPIVPVAIGPPGSERPTIWGLRALVDSGASNCLMTPALSERAGFPFVGTGTVLELGREPIESPLYRGRLFIPWKRGGYAIDLAEIGVCAFNGPYDFIVGRKALHQASVIIRFADGDVTIAV